MILVLLDNLLLGYIEAWDMQFCVKNMVIQNSLYLEVFEICISDLVLLIVGTLI